MPSPQSHSSRETESSGQAGPEPSEGDVEYAAPVSVRSAKDTKKRPAESDLERPEVLPESPGSRAKKIRPPPKKRKLEPYRYLQPVAKKEVSKPAPVSHQPAVTLSMQQQHPMIVSMPSAPAQAISAQLATLAQAQAQAVQLLAAQNWAAQVQSQGAQFPMPGVASMATMMAARQQASLSSNSILFYNPYLGLQGGQPNFLAAAAAAAAAAANGTTTTSLSRL